MTIFAHLGKENSGLRLAVHRRARRNLAENGRKRPYVDITMSLIYAITFTPLLSSIRIISSITTSQTRRASATLSRLFIHRFDQVPTSPIRLDWVLAMGNKKPWRKARLDALSEYILRLVTKKWSIIHATPLQWTVKYKYYNYLLFEREIFVLCLLYVYALWRHYVDYLDLHLTSTACIVYIRQHCRIRYKAIEHRFLREPLYSSRLISSPPHCLF